ncbi:biogenesis of lysosome-related organelles complex 1 subunit 3-like [Uloborus diversus]|uniref:biogenesis of lysosome-related organelles complex 1 subunit 3-like n=1 Tax=Uloborus diversus TaxID=327109 RepID=UPI002409E807|nr:biogenesis of lysosome-related organelles complex 1 subunit 3-like [Uloborus diversus]
MANSVDVTSGSSVSDTNVSEPQDEVRIVFPSSGYAAASRIPHGIVISGEASESDEEIDTHHALPQSASDFSISDWGKSSAELPGKDATREGSSVQYNTLLHKKLREKNQGLRKNIVELVTQPYESASKEIHTISQQLIKSQLLVQELRNTIQRLTNDLFDMEDKMEALRTGAFLPEMLNTPTSE